MQAIGTFTVEMTPVGEGSANGIGRMALAKEFSGDLSGTSEGEMLTAVTDTPGSAGYVALERVDGTLAGRTGSFVLQHFGLAQESGNRLTIEIVPDSGSGELRSISGTMEIEADEHGHRYSLSYTLADTDGERSK